MLGILCAFGVMLRLLRLAACFMWAHKAFHGGQQFVVMLVRSAVVLLLVEACDFLVAYPSGGVSFWVCGGAKSCRSVWVSSALAALRSVQPLTLGVVGGLLPGRTLSRPPSLFVPVPLVVRLQCLWILVAAVWRFADEETLIWPLLSGVGGELLL